MAGVMGGAGAETAVGDQRKAERASELAWSDRGSAARCHGERRGGEDDPERRAEIAKKAATKKWGG